MAKRWFMVLKGEMSVVGPELLTIEEQNILQQQTFDYLWLNDVKPGIISESSIYLPSDNEHLFDRVQLDLKYISTRTLLRDCIIMYDYMVMKLKKLK